MPSANYPGPDRYMVFLPSPLGLISYKSEKTMMCFLVHMKAVDILPPAEAILNMCQICMIKSKPTDRWIGIEVGQRRMNHGEVICLRQFRIESKELV